MRKHDLGEERGEGRERGHEAGLRKMESKLSRAAYQVETKDNSQVLSSGIPAYSKSLPARSFFTFHVSEHFLWKYEVN